MQIPKQIYFKQTTPRGGKLTATIEGDDLPNIIQVKGTNDINCVKRKRERYRVLELADGGSRDWEDERRNDDDDDDEDYRDDRGCHKQTVGTWESKNKYTSLKQTLIFMKKFRCKRIIQIASYDDQGKLIVTTPTATIKDQSITATEGEVELKWTSVTEVQIKEYISEVKLPGSSSWTKFDTDLPLGAGTQYTATHYPTAPGSTAYRLKATFENNTETTLLEQPVQVAPPPNRIELQYFDAPVNGGITAVAFKSSVEVGVAKLILSRRSDGETSYTLLREYRAEGTEVEHTYEDNSGAFGLVFYKVSAEFTDGTLLDLVEEISTEVF